MRAKRLTIVLVGSACLLAAACSNEPVERDTPRVASFQSASSGPTTAASARPERPRERLDTTPEEYEAMLEPYNQCMREQGAKPKADWKGRQMTDKSEWRKYEAADKICDDRTPLPPWERDPANPKSKDFALAVVKCLKGKGVKYVEVDEDGSIALGGEQNDKTSISKGMNLMPECERESAAAGK